MRRALLFAIPVLALALTGCPTKPKDGTCKSSEDCADSSVIRPSTVSFPWAS